MAGRPRRRARLANPRAWRGTKMREGAWYAGLPKKRFRGKARSSAAPRVAVVIPPNLSRAHLRILRSVLADLDRMTSSPRRRSRRRKGRR